MNTTITTAVQPLSKNELWQHTINAFDNASVYVSTYGKYADGSLEGTWIDLQSFGDASQAMDFLRRLHSDEEDPEFMFQDYSNLPRALYHESMNEDDLVKIYEWLSLEEDERDMVKEYWDEHDGMTEIQDIIDRCVYHGDPNDYFDELADEMLDECKVPDFLRYCFDYEKWRYQCQFDYIITSNYVFHE